MAIAIVLLATLASAAPPEITLNPATLDAILLTGDNHERDGSQGGYVMTPEAIDQFCFATSTRLMKISSGRIPVSLCNRAAISA